MDKVERVLAELLGERERLTVELARVGRAIEALEEASGRGAAGKAPASPATASVRRAAAAPYAMLDLYEATAAFLATVDEPQNSGQIAEALRAGGFKTRSANFTGTVRTMLRRPAHIHVGISTTSDGKRWFIRAKK